VWSVIESKWPGFEAAFLGFEPRKLLMKPDEFWEGLVADKRIVRNPQKIMAVRGNARFVSDIAKEHGSFGKFLAAWPVTDQIGLLDLLAKRGTRLGGNTGQYLFLGKDSFITSRDMVLCLRDAGLEIAETPTSRRDLLRIQAQLNAWAEESGRPLMHISRICAMSIGENHDAETLRGRMGGGEE
jgi:3-methyladenine DNA glycosylase Tag